MNNEIDGKEMRAIVIIGKRIVHSIIIINNWDDVCCIDWEADDIGRDDG